MSTATISRPAPRPARALQPRVHPVRRPVPTRGPLPRPARGGSAATDPGRRPAARACRLDGAAARSTWRLTDRGIAVVLVLAAMIAVAAVTVVGLTAWRVTGSDAPTWSSAVSSR